MITVISGNNFFSNSISSVIANNISQYDRVLFITATSSLKRERKNTLEIYNAVELCSYFGTISEFEQEIKRTIYKGGNCISFADQRFLLNKSIETIFGYSENKVNVYKSIQNELYDLFATLMFNEAIIDEKFLHTIENEYSITESDIFKLYIEFKNEIGKLILSCSDKSDYKSFLECKKELIQTIIKSNDAVFFDGFLFFDDVQSFVIKTALDNNIPVFITTKVFDENLGGFIVKNVIDKFSENVRIIDCKTADLKVKTALDLAKTIYPKIDFSLSNGSNIKDGSIRFISPFVNRDEELRYIVNSISQKLKNAYDGTCSSIVNELSKIAIVTGINKDAYEQRISDLLSETGAFFKRDAETIKKYNIDLSRFDNVIFSKKEFIESNIDYTNGLPVSFEEKLKLFSKCFEKIRINEHIRPISSYPIGQFVLCLYNIAINGITPDDFKSIMYSNWKYNIEASSIKWSDLLSNFNCIKVWFEKKTSINDWIIVIDSIISVKNSIKNKPLYKYHPINCVEFSSLQIMKELIYDIKSLTDKILSVSGNMKEHVNLLQTIILRADNIVDRNPEELVFEQKIIKRFIDTVSEIADTSVIGNVSSRFFAENIRAMLTEYETENEETNNEYRLDVVNLENMHQYDTCYFFMCESDNYPRRYKTDFPFTESMCSILSKIGALPSNKFGIEYHLELEKYLLKNVLDFTNKELIITHTTKEGNSNKSISVFAEDIATIFDDIVHYESHDSRKSDINLLKSEKKKRYLPRKDNYTLTELATFKLCPRLYYHLQTNHKTAYSSRLQLRFYAEAIMFCDIMCRFISYNIENTKVYDIVSNECYIVLDKIKSSVLSEVSKNFSFLSNYEINDIDRNISNKITSSIENSKKYVTGKSFTVVGYDNKSYKGEGYTLTIEHDTRFVDYDNKKWRMSQNGAYIEFLVLKTSGRKSQLVHYKDMIAAINDKTSDEDRINLISRIIAKINIQFDSKRFAMDGIKRTNELVEELCSYDFSNAEAFSSGYCSYCRLNDVCMGK